MSGFILLYELHFLNIVNAEQGFYYDVEYDASSFSKKSHTILKSDRLLIINLLFIIDISFFIKLQFIIKSQVLIFYLRS